MGKLLKIKTNMVWPWGVVFRIPDTFNGPKRGEWFYRHDHTGEVRGPFKHQSQAQLSLDLERSIELA